MYNFLKEQIEIYSSKSFRRLAEKNQIVANFNEKNVHITNRLTHSLEVGVVAKMITEKLPIDLNLNQEQIFNICLLHDIGHPSLGHFLEEKLNDILGDSKYFFEGNANNFVIIEKENIVLSDKTLISLIKYPQELNSSNKKGIYSYQFERLIKMLLREYIRQQKSFLFNGYSKDNISQINYIENTLLNKKNITNKDLLLLQSKFPEQNIRTIESKIMEAADDIAYLTHDLADFMIHTSQKSKSKNSLKKLVNIKEYSSSNQYMKYLYVLTSDNAKSISSQIRKLFINNISFDFEKSDLILINQDIEDFKLILRKLLLKEFIYPECDILEQKFIDKDIYNKYFEKIEDNEFIDEIVISGTYRKLINDTNDLEKKFRYMANYLAEKTDKWLF
jgi:predicted deoxyguanosinetriphosphate triphosphohydrolase